MNNNFNNTDINKLMELLSKMDKSELEKGLNQAAKILGNGNAEEILNKFKK